MRNLNLLIGSMLFLAVGCAGPAAPTAPAAPAASAAPGAPIPANAPAMAGAAVVAQHDSTAELARNFTLKTLTGDRVTLENLRGQWVVLNFWATWCPPCVREMPYLAQMSTHRDVTVLGINVDESADVVARFVAEHALPFPILMEPDESMQLVYGVRGLPLTVVVAPDGTIAHTVIGAINPTKFDAWLEEQRIGYKTGS